MNFSFNKFLQIYLHRVHFSSNCDILVWCQNREIQGKHYVNGKRRKTANGRDEEESYQYASWPASHANHSASHASQASHRASQDIEDIISALYDVYFLHPPDGMAPAQLGYTRAKLKHNTRWLPTANGKQSFVVNLVVNLSNIFINCNGSYIARPNIDLNGFTRQEETRGG